MNRVVLALCETMVLVVRNTYEQALRSFIRPLNP